MTFQIYVDKKNTKLCFQLQGLKISMTLSQTIYLCLFFRNIFTILAIYSDNTALSCLSIVFKISMQLLISATGSEEGVKKVMKNKSQAAVEYEFQVTPKKKKTPATGTTSGILLCILQGYFKNFVK